ncbi:MAG: hypothetical protein H7255_11560 [Ramlibacter sp.]|nr:hypothetical protein [Ramlibacter sp.]
MTPMSFDIETARDVVGEDKARILESTARLDADAGVFNLPVAAFDEAVYWGAVKNEMQRIVYAAQHTKRVARNTRKAEAGETKRP